MALRIFAKNKKMAKVFKRSGSKDFSAKGSAGKGKSKFSAKKDPRDSSEKKTSYSRPNDDSRPSGKFKAKDEKGFNSDKAPESKKTRIDKRDNKPVFERFRDDSRPSDFGTSKNRGTSNYNDSHKKSDSDKPPFKKKYDDGDEKPSFRDRSDDKPRSFNKKPFSDKPAFKKRRDDGDNKPSFRESSDDKPRSFNKKPFSEKPAFKKRRDDGDNKPSLKERENNTPRSFGKKPFSEKPAFVRKSDGVNSNDLKESDFEYDNEKPKYNGNSGRPFKKSKPSTNKKSGSSTPQRETDDGLIRLNKYLSNAGICSRREADDLISSGVVQVNGKTITEGYRVKPTDIVKYGGQTLKKERLVYLILNKPKDYITTVDDPQERRTVLELVQDACKERIYPVGRLDRATTGLLMFTNDGDLTKKLTHPRYGVRKIYHVELDKPLKKVDLEKISEGIELEDGPIKVDEVSYVGDGADKTQVGVEIHSGKNRIVRRIFEHMGYNVRKLDRVMFGSLTKKDLPRGRWRILSDAEVGMLKMISAD